MERKHCNVSSKKQNSFIDRGTGQIISAGFVKSSSGKDALNINHTWEFFLCKVRGLDLGRND